MKKNAAKHRRSALVTTSPTRKNTSTKSRGATFPIVGIGASAGGLAALGELLSALPAASGMAYVIISHMDATHESMLDTLLAKKSKLSVQRAANGTTVEPDHVYVIQPGTHIDLRAGVLFTTKRADGSPAPQVIDHFFESLATDRGASARGVVLSGIGRDGTQGLKFIRERGGIAFAQDPKTAQFDSMPRSAIESGAVD